MFNITSRISWTPEQIDEVIKSCPNYNFDNVPDFLDYVDHITMDGKPFDIDNILYDSSSIGFGSATLATANTHTVKYVMKNNAPTDVYFGLLMCCGFFNEVNDDYFHLQCSVIKTNLETIPMFFTGEFTYHLQDITIYLTKDVKQLEEDWLFNDYSYEHTYTYEIHYEGTMEHAHTLFKTFKYNPSDVSEYYHSENTRCLNCKVVCKDGTFFIEPDVD